MRGLEEVELDVLALEGADPDGLFLVALRPYPYMMAPKQVADFLGLTPPRNPQAPFIGKHGGMPHRDQLAHTEALLAAISVQRAKREAS